MPIRTPFGESPSSAEMLPLTPFEELLFWEDRPDNPCWIVVRGTIRGKFEHAAMDRAFAELVRRHPLLRSVIQRRFAGLFWRKLPDWKPAVVWYAGPLTDGAPHLEPIDITKAPGLRLILCEHGEMTELVFQLHHAVCDGKGLQNLTTDLITCYLQEIGKTVRRPEINPLLLHERHQGVSIKPSFNAFLFQLLGAWIAFCAQLKSIATVIPGLQDKKYPDLYPVYPSIAKVRLDDACLKKINDAAQKQSVTMNDLFVRDLQTALGLWWKKQGIDRPRDRIRILIPVSLRRPSHRALSAANVASMVSLDCASEELDDPDKRLEDIRNVMGWIKFGGMSSAFLNLLHIFSFIPGGIRFLSRRVHFFRGTIILSNLAKHAFLRHDRQLVIDGAVVENFTLTGPLRPGTHASLMIMNYDGRLLLDLNYNPRFLTEKQAVDLLDAFVDRLKSYE